MTPVRRWCIVAVGLALVIGTPLTLRAMPAQDEDVSASDLLARVEASTNHAYSGYVESLGTLELPVADRFTDVGALFGERTRMRVWWQSADEWRVDKVLATGETDLFHTDWGYTTTWDYEKNEVTQYRDPSIRLPRTSDLLPPEVVRRLLSDVRGDELTRLAPRRVAGRDALGLRLSPAAPQSSIDHVDAWVDPGTGDYTIASLLDGSSAAGTRLRGILAIRVAMILRTSLSERGDPVAPPTLTLFEDMDPALQQTRTLAAAERQFRHRVVETTIPLRNILMLP